MKDNINLVVEALAGAHVNNVAKEMLELSKQLDMLIVSRFNGTQMLARPNQTVAQVVADWALWSKARNDEH